MGDLRFACIWQKLCECYSNNGRSIERAYGYFQEIDNLYSNVVSGAVVQRVVFTNVRVERAEHRDALVAAATNKGIFYAVLTLTAAEDVSAATGRGDWWQESLFSRVSSATSFSRSCSTRVVSMWNRKRRRSKKCKRRSTTHPTSAKSDAGRT